MPDPVLHVIAGPNGAGKTTFYREVLEPATHLEFVNANAIAAERWPGETTAHTYDAARLAAEERDLRMAERQSFATETVFSHESKLDLVHAAVEAGYLVSLHIIVVPEGLAVARVADRVKHGGHDVPVEKIRERYARLWRHLRAAITVAAEAHIYDNTSAARPYRLVATYRHGRLTGTARWPAWAPKDLRQARH